MSTITYFSLYNCALAGAAAGMLSQRQALYENGGSAVEPADSNVLCATSALYAKEVDALLVSASPAPPASVLDMVFDGSTVIPTTAALASASAYLPVVMALMSKSIFENRGIPTDAEGEVYDQAEWTASLIPNAIVSYFLAFSNNTYADGGDVVKFVPLANVAMGAAMAGMISGRQDLYDGNGNPLAQTSFATQVATAAAFAAEIDAQLVAQQIALGGGFPTHVADMVGAPDWSTVPPTTNFLTNALYTYTPAMGCLCKAIFDGRGIPKDANGVAYVQADYADMANTVVAQFLQYAINGVVVT
jgi:hypothetical protein